MKAIYVTIWDVENNVTEIRSRCEYDPETKDITDIDKTSVFGLESLDDQYVELFDGSTITNFTIYGQEI